MSLKRTACLACFLGLAACSPAGNVSDTIAGLTEALVPDAQREFARQYSDYLLDGNIPEALAMAETRQFCLADLRGTSEASPELEEERRSCASDAALLQDLRYLAGEEPPENVQVSHYRWHSNANNSIELDITLEYQFNDKVIRSDIHYRRNGDERWIEQASVTIDSMTWQQRFWQQLDEAALFPIWWLFAIQLIVYLSAPVIVLLILRRQRREREAMLKRTPTRSGTFKA